MVEITSVQNKFLTALAKIGSTSYLPFSKTRPKAYIKNNSTCPNDSTVASRKVQKIDLTKQKASAYSQPTETPQRWA